ncbi:MAG TPA: carboxyltransferase domain-containing protein [Thermoanaerobaculia bacterium]|jgi:allophanate hydrolase subunit 1
MQIAPAGDRAVLIELGEVTAEELHAMSNAARAIPGVLRVTPGHSSLYVICDRAPDLTALANIPRQPATGNRQRITTHHIPVSFTGPDLEAFLSHVNITREAFLARIPTIRLVARYLGFRAGFAYLDGWPEEWSMPRRPTSRPVAAGSFAIAGNVAGFYPIDTPGGWNVLGRTAADLSIAPGDEIQLSSRSAATPVAALVRPPTRAAAPAAALLQAPLATWTGAPFDTIAAALANEAVGNAPNAPILECPFAGPRIRFAHDATIAWCTPDLGITVERVRINDERHFGRITGGLRAYLAIGDGPPRPASGRRTGNRLRIHARNGPHDLGLANVECEVTPQLDRVGIRLRPLQPLRVDVPADLKSIGMQCGTVQLHPDGSLVAMGPDHPVTGGYLQPMTVLSSERWKLAQLVPGERITFVLDQLPNA